MSEIAEDRLAEYLSGRLADSDVSITELTEHVKGWSRTTASFTARWSEEGRERSAKLVVRVVSDSQVASDPLGNDLETEFATMEAARSADVPVPDTYWYEDDASILGNRFFLVEHLPGTVPVTWDPEQRQELYDAWDSDDRSLPRQFVEAAAGIHELQGTEVPGIDPVDAGDVVDRELEKWIPAYRHSTLKPNPVINEAIRWFRKNKPEISETTLVHGDFRIGNMLVEDEAITGVLDWEMSRVGDPLYDLGYASTNYFAGKLLEPIERPELACSLLEREWFYEEYERLTGRTVDRERIRYWRAFSAFVMLTIGLNWVHRYSTGASDDVRSAWSQYLIPGLSEDILAIIRKERV